METTFLQRNISVTWYPVRVKTKICRAYETNKSMNCYVRKMHTWEKHSQKNCELLHFLSVVPRFPEFDARLTFFRASIVYTWWGLFCIITSVNTLYYINKYADREKKIIAFSRKFVNII